MPKYYVAGIPFDSEDALMHYGVKGMKWDKHIFGPDANTKYINWMDVGKMASSKKPSNFTDTGSNRSASSGGSLGAGSQQKGPGPVQSAYMTARKAGKAVGNAARAVGGALNASSNFITGNQAKQGVNNAQRAYNQNKQQLVNNARLYNKGKANVQNANNMANDATQRYMNAANNPSANPNAQNNLINDMNRAAELTNRGNQQMEYSNSQKNDIMNNVLASRNAVNEAQNAYDKTLPGAAKGFINSAGKWVSNAVRDTGNWLNQAGDNIRNGNVTNAVSKAVTDAGNSVGDWVGNAARDTGNWVNQAGDNIRNGNVDSAISKAASDVGRTVTNAGNAVGDWFGNAVRDTGNWFNQAGDNIRNGNVASAVSNAANDASRWVGDRASDVGQAASNVANFVTGNQARQNVADATRRSIDAGNRGQGADVDAAREAYNRTTVPGWIDSAGRWISNTANNVGQWVGDRASDVGQAASNVTNLFTNQDELGRLRDASNAHDNEAAAKAYQDYANNPITKIGNAVNSIGKRAGNIASDVGDWVNTNAQKVANSPAGKLVGQRASDVGNAVGDWVGQRASDVGQAASNVGNAIGDFVSGNQARQNLESIQNAWNPFGINNGRIAEAQEAYNRTLPGMVNQAGDWIGNTASNAGTGISNAAGDVGKALERAYGDASKWVVDNAGVVRDAVNGAALGTADWAVQQYNRLFHSAIDDKPDGVTDTFWKNYIASGGTREQYERDWR